MNTVWTHWLLSLIFSLKIPRDLCSLLNILIALKKLSFQEETCYTKIS